jgi:uncharacterized membrane protein YidH (DUF202 family)
MAKSELSPARFQGLVDQGILTSEGLTQVLQEAAARDRQPEWILVHERGVARRTLLDLFSVYHGCPAVEFDERLCVPPELLEGADAGQLSRRGRFPLLQSDEGIVIATVNPEGLREEGAGVQGSARTEPWVAFAEDIDWYIEDFLHAPPGKLIGTERTGLAFWRNTMAQWRTRLACYRTEFAKTRTSLTLVRTGLGHVAIGNVLLRSPHAWSSPLVAWLLIAFGICLATVSVPGYWKIRRSRVRPPGNETLVEVTSATLHFLDAYTPASPSDDSKRPSRLTMLARLADLLQEHRQLLYPPPTQKERAPLARERNVLAGQRTVAACYRTIYARARTGLAFIRTGISFAGLGIGLIRYFGLSLITSLDVLLVVAGLLLAADGLWWYLPVRKEQAEIPELFKPGGGGTA